VKKDEIERLYDEVSTPRALSERNRAGKDWFPLAVILITISWLAFLLWRSS
jgi:hypothetical protein